MALMPGIVIQNWIAHRCRHYIEADSEEKYRIQWCIEGLLGKVTTPKQIHRAWAITRFQLNQKTCKRAVKQL